MLSGRDDNVKDWIDCRIAYSVDWVRYCFKLQHEPESFVPSSVSYRVTYRRMTGKCRVFEGFVDVSHIVRFPRMLQKVTSPNATCNVSFPLQPRKLMFQSPATFQNNIIRCRSP